MSKRQTELTKVAFREVDAVNVGKNKRKKKKSKVTRAGALYMGEGPTETSNMSFTLSCLV